MAEVIANGATIRGPLAELLRADALIEGSKASYQLCKDIFMYHPLGAKLAQMPVELAQSQRRVINIPCAAEEMVREQFLRVYKEMGIDQIILSTATIARVYGAGGAVAMDRNNTWVPGTPLSRDMIQKDGVDLVFNILDPLNMSGSFVLTQDPNDPNFQKHLTVQVAGTAYNPSRACVLLNEQPIYISFTDSAFGYVGRSVYQRILYPLQSFIESMRTDRLVARKAGLIVAKIDQGGSLADNIMAAVSGFKRWILKIAETDDVISIGTEEDIAAIDLTNVHEAHDSARKHILENIAAGAPMPALLLNNETFGGTMSEGEEDAKNVARYVARMREWLDTAYMFFDQVVMWKAWTPEFFERVKLATPEYKDKKYTFDRAFTEWQEAYQYEWPNLLIEPDSEAIKTETVKARELIGLYASLAPSMSPEGLTKLIQFVQTNMNENESLFPNKLDLPFDELLGYLKDQAQLAQDQQELQIEAAQASLDASKQAMEQTQQQSNKPGDKKGGSSKGPAKPPGANNLAKGETDYNVRAHRTPPAAGGKELTPKPRGMFQ